MILAVSSLFTSLGASSNPNRVFSRALGQRVRDCGPDEDDRGAWDRHVNRHAPQPRRLGRRRHLRPGRNPHGPGYAEESASK